MLSLRDTIKSSGLFCRASGSGRFFKNDDIIAFAHKNQSRRAGPTYLVNRTDRDVGCSQQSVTKTTSKTIITAGMSVMRLLCISTIEGV